MNVYEMTVEVVTTSHHKEATSIYLKDQAKKGEKRAKERYGETGEYRVRKTEGIGEGFSGGSLGMEPFSTGQLTRRASC